MGLMARMGPIHWAVGATALLRCSTRVVLAVDTERIKLQVVSQFGTRRELGVGVVFFFCHGCVVSNSKGYRSFSRLCLIALCTFAVP